MIQYLEVDEEADSSWLFQLIDETNEIQRRNRLPREVADAPSLQVFKAKLDVTLSYLI